MRPLVGSTEQRPRKAGFACSAPQGTPAAVEATHLLPVCTHKCCEALEEWWSLLLVGLDGEGLQQDREHLGGERAEGAEERVGMNEG